MNRMVDEKGICFILCSNNPMYTEECIYYINHLDIPESYHIEILTIKGAKSMTAGYNEGMRSSGAKYKVYLHQDTFIVNHNFIQDFLDVFRQDEQVGMIGMVGAPKLPVSGIMWDKERCGALYAWTIHETVESWMGEDALTEVEVVDGFLMITQYDIPWREDLFDKWDFYDCSQCKEFTRRGYKIVVPKMGQPWCLHDSGFVSIANYEGERLKFLEEYGKEIPACQELASYKATVILTSHNQKSALQDTLQWLAGVEGVSNIIVADNGSEDGTAQWLATQPYEYIWFDEGVQGFGKVWNAVIENFETEDYIIFLAAGVYPEAHSLIKMMQTLCTEHVEIVSPLSNFYPYKNDIVTGRDGLAELWEGFQELPKEMQHKRTLVTNWKMWAVHKSIFDKNGYFREELKAPGNVLSDYALRLIANDFSQLICHRACAYDSIRYCGEVYAETEKWNVEDRMALKDMWGGMNYFNLKPNWELIGRVSEDREKEFKVLEVGCDLGATLFEIQSRYPKCKTYGLDINEAAVNIAKHITDTRYGNIDELTIPFDEKFDYIIFGDVLEHLRHPEEVIAMCRDILNENGYIIASIPNIMHLSVLEKLIEGRFIYEDTGLLDRTHIHFFTYYEIMWMFHRADYVVIDMGRETVPLSDKQKQIGKILLPLSEDTEDWMFDTTQYILKARKKSG